jgi:hypothetical protein
MLRRASILFPCLLLACSSETTGSPDGGPRPDARGTPDASAGEVCASLRAEFSPVIPTVMLVVDRSGSMRADHGGVSRWAAVYGALMDPASGIVPRLAGDVRFGLLLYSGHDSNPNASCPTLHEVAPALDNAGTIDALYGAMQPGEGTPTGAAMSAAGPLLGAVTEPGPKLIILATDGDPDTCEAPSEDSSAAARAAVLSATQAAHGAEIKTFVIGVGTSVTSEHLQEVANAGQGLPPAGPDSAPYYRAVDAAQLVDAFTEIIHGARGCVFELDTPLPVDPDLAEGVVSLDGVPLDRGTDWQLIDEGTLELLGAACDAILAGGDHLVEASFTCPEDDPTVVD